MDVRNIISYGETGFRVIIETALKIKIILIDSTIITCFCDIIYFYKK